MFIHIIKKNLWLLSIILIASTANATDRLVINGTSKHFNTPLHRNSNNYGLGYEYKSHELGFYRNSRERATSFSLYYSWNKELTKIKGIPVGLRLGGALYDDSQPYDYTLKPIIAGFTDIPVTNKAFIRLSGTYNLIGAQLLINLK